VLRQQVLAVIISVPHLMQAQLAGPFISNNYTGYMVR
jgi:hypothetical protein